MLLRTVIGGILALAAIVAHAQINGGGGPSGGSGGSCNTLGGSLSGTCAAATVATNANLTGPITSTGNATAIASQTGTGTKFVVDTSPTLVTPVLGVATGTSLALGAGSAVTSTGAGGALGTAAFVNTGTSGGTIPLLSGANTWSAVQAYSAGTTFAAATLPAAASGQLAISGISPAPTFGANGEGAIWITATGGVVHGGQGSTYDATILNKTNQTVMGVLTGTQSPQFPGLSTGTNADVVCLSSAGTMLIQAAASCTISSVRFKNMHPSLDPTSEGALAASLRLKPVAFTMKPGERPNPDNNYAKLQIGLTAENIAEAMPLCTIWEQDGKTPKAYREGCVIAELIGAIHEQQKKIAALQRRIH